MGNKYTSFDFIISQVFVCGIIIRERRGELVIIHPRSMFIYASEYIYYLGKNKFIVI